MWQFKDDQSLGTFESERLIIYGERLTASTRIGEASARCVIVRQPARKRGEIVAGSEVSFIKIQIQRHNRSHPAAEVTTSDATTRVEG